ncbi:hypothetical protein NA57DRAFT_78257 [Rhizodiscina lignyota]|uniref:BAH domain-containing protein n=1 Tax=Rhizodiscina lignyota TaxID=1504668 RepID=A0A9P4M6T4_9PEZI|nr:hypothetical protein NA57DRAFT_78257 [Rhizodiscina lignyota]
MSRKSKTPSRRQSTEDGPSTKIDWNTIGPDFSFEVHPYPPPNRKRKRDDLTEPQAQENPLTKKIEPMLYCVSPQHLWEDAKRYRKFTIARETFEVNDIILVQNEEDDPAPQVKSSKKASSVAEFLKNKWVAQVLDVRAGDEQHVYLRVYWLFRPEDLPIGRQPYHGTMEVIPSNEMQIIDAMTVDGKITIKHWDEDDDDADCPSDYVYWRQVFDTRKGKTGLSELRKHCVCESPANPDNPIVQCTSCKTWLHAECLEEEAVKRAYEKEGAEYPGEATTNGEMNGTKSITKKKRGRKSKSTGRSSTGQVALFKAELVSPSPDGDETTWKIRVTDLRDGDGEENMINIRCLICDAEID